jgi:DNA helicase-2/ATP-dependent DNA helicase PcrA
VHTGAERKLKRHVDCAPNYDEQTYASLVAWRLEQANQRSVPAFVIFTDATLMAIAEERPTDNAGLLAVPGVGRTKCDLYAESVLAILATEGTQNGP